MPTAVVRLAYNGEPFCGFARQTKQPVPTVQGSLEKALATVFRRPVDTVCAGRTDTGVHALGQVVSFQIADEERARLTERSLVHSLNALTPEAVSVRRAVCAPDEGFSARFSAKSREYRYFFNDAVAAPLVMHRFCAQSPGRLDTDAMTRAARLLVGEHDFKSFCVAASAEGKSTVRELFDVDVERCEVMGDELVLVRVVGNAFLHSMVRTLAGTLAMVGRGLREPDWVGDVLAARDRAAAGEKAPASGLVFWKVDYGHALDGARW